MANALYRKIRIEVRKFFRELKKEPQKVILSEEELAEQKKKKKELARKKNKISKKHLVQAIGSGNAVIMSITLLLLAFMLIIRFGALTDFGREQIVKTFDGIKVGRIGNLSVEGLEGDIFTKFSLRYAAISDSQGIWIEGRNFKAEWDSLALTRALIHINKVEANGVRIYRRPILSKREKWLKRYLLALKIDIAKSPIESFEGFSVVHGIGGAAGKLELHHNKDFKLRAKLISIKRFSDGASIDLETHDGVPVYSFISASESSGGAIAGALGLDTNKSLLINSRLWAKSDTGNIDTIGLTGGQKFAAVKGNWNKKGGAINGVLDFSASKLTRSIATMFGQNVGLNSVWSQKNEATSSRIYNTSLTLNGNNALLRLNGPIDFKTRRSIAPLDLNLNIASISDFLQSPSIKGASANSAGKLDISKTGAIFDGNFGLKSVSFAGVSLDQLNGPINVSSENGQSEIKLSFFGQGGNTQNMISRAIGINPRGNLNVTRFVDGRWFVNLIEIYGQALNLKGSGNRNLFGALELNGKAILNVAPIIGRNYSGQIDTNFKAVQSQNSGQTIIQTESVGKQIRTNSALLDKIIGVNPTFSSKIQFAGNVAAINDIQLQLDEINATGKSLNLAAPIATLGGNIKLGEDALKVGFIKGTESGTWALAINKANAGAALSLDLLGANVSTQSSILDGFLTKTPKIKGVITFNEVGAQISAGQLSSPKANIDFGGGISRTSGFGINLNWKVQGPTNFGKIEIAGNMNGTGALTGPLSAPILRLNSVVDELNLGAIKLKSTNFETQINLGQSVFQADLSLNGNSDFGKINSGGTLVAVSNGFEVQNIKIDGAGISGRGSARILKNRDPSADIAFTIAQGALLQSGNLSGRLLLAQRGNQTMANVMANGNSFGFRGSNIVFSNLNISGNGPLSNLNLETKFATIGDFPILFNGSTNVAGQNNIYGLIINGRGSMGGRNFTISDPVKLGFEDGKQSAKGIINFASSTAINQGYLDFDFEQNQQSVQNHIKAQNLALTLLNRDLMGTFSGEIDINGRAQDLRGFMFGELKDARTRGLNNNLALNGNVNARLNRSELSVDLSAQNSQGLVIETKANLPVISSASPLRLAIERSKPLSGEFDVKGEIRPLADLVFAGERILSGHLDSKGKFAGSLNSPKLIGNFKLERGAFREASIGLNLANLNLNGQTDGDKISINSFAANDNARGTISGQGEIVISGPDRSSFTINTKRFRLIDSETTKIDATTALTLARTTAQKASLSGNMYIDFAQFSPKALSGNRIVNIEVEEINRPLANSNGARIGESPNANQSNMARSVRSNQENVDLDINIDAPRGVFVRGSGLNLELSLDAKARGSLGAPNLTGLAKVYRGEYEYGGRSFVFDDSGTIVLSSNPNNIRLNLVAERQDNNLTAKITISGTAADPKVKLSSTPELPQDEILAQVLFGRSRAQLTPLETVQLAANLANLASGGGFDVISNLRDITRLDRLVFSNTATGEISVAGGKYLGRDLYLELISEGTQGISSRVEWRPTKSTAVISRLGAEGDARISIRWRRDIK